MTSSHFRSTVEQLFEKHVEERDDIEWFYKNGDTGQQYLSIIYGTNVNKEYLFYPDYIVKKKTEKFGLLRQKVEKVKIKVKILINKQRTNLLHLKNMLILKE